MFVSSTSPAGESAPADAGIKWVRFAQRILAVLVVAVMLLGVVLTYLATAQARDLLEDSLAKRGRSTGRAAARAAFVPLMLEDSEALAVVVGDLFASEDLVFLRIEDVDRRLMAERVRRGKPVPVLEMTFPVVPINETTAPPEEDPTPIGHVRIGIDRGEVDAQIARTITRNLAVGAFLMALAIVPAFFIIRGMTARMEAMVGEVRLTEALRRSNEDLESFAYVASHDLQEPLRMVSAYTTLLGETYRGKLDATADEYIAFAVDGATRMQQLIKDLLAYSRVRTQVRPFEPVDLAVVAAESLKDLKAAIEESSAELDVGPLPLVLGDRVQLRQLFQNLLGNALKYKGAECPRVMIRAVRDGNLWAITVADNGIGIDPRHADRIFLPFQRLHTRREYPGTGMGLAIVRQIVERHGGRIRVESDGRSGAAFHFTLQAPGEEGAKT